MVDRVVDGKEIKRNSCHSNGLTTTRLRDLHKETPVSYRIQDSFGLGR